MGIVVSLDSRRLPPLVKPPHDSPMRDEPVMLLFDTEQGIEQRLAFFLFEDSESVTVSSVLPACADSTQRVDLDQLAAMIFVSRRASRQVV